MTTTHTEPAIDLRSAALKAYEDQEAQRKQQQQKAAAEHLDGERERFRNTIAGILAEAEAPEPGEARGAASRRQRERLPLAAIRHNAAIERFYLTVGGFEWAWALDADNRQLRLFVTCPCGLDAVISPYGRISGYTDLWTLAELGEALSQPHLCPECEERAKPKPKPEPTIANEPTAAPDRECEEASRLLNALADFIRELSVE